MAWPAVIRDSIVPSLKEQSGFGGFVVCQVDREHGKSIGCSMWDSEADLTACQASGNY